MKNLHHSLKICGLQKTTLLDYPGCIAATIFTGGCNFRCPFCHNKDLLSMDSQPEYSVSEILEFLKKRKGILDGICITGGEPSLQPEALEDFILQVRSLGLRIKLDTNGSHPALIRRLAEKGLLDYIAMDIKAGPDNYPAACGVQPDMDAVRESVGWLLTNPLPFEFRTTAVKGLHSKEDFCQIGPWISGCSSYFIQNYIPSEQVLHPEHFDSFTKDELLSFAKIIAPFVGNVQLRGID